MRSPEHRHFQSEFAKKYTALGKAEVVRVLLAERFGRIPGEVEKRIQTGTADQMDTWTKRLLSAKTLEDVFRSGARARPRHSVGASAAARRAPKRRQR